MDINDDISKLHIKCEKRVHKHPALYKLALIAYILYGYAYIAFIALILLFLIIIMLFGSLVQPFAILVEFIFIPILWKILKNIFKMFIPLPLPRYSARLPDHSPLVKLAGDICEKMKIRHIDNIYLTADINASVGFYKGKASVFIGAPLMAILNNEQFETIIAHELAHIKLRHGWAARFIYHSGSYWNKLIYDMSWNSVTGMGFAFMGKFYAKFINRLNAKSLALSKYNEYIADGIAADISGGMSADKTDGKSAKINERVSADIPGGKSAGVTGRTLFAETISILHIFSYAKDVYDIWGDYFKKALTDEIPPNLFDFLAGELKKIESDFCNCKEAGISALSFVIFGFPDETPAQIKQTVHTIFRLNPTTYSTFLFTPMPGTAEYNNLVASGRLAPPSDITSWANWEDRQMVHVNYSAVPDRELKVIHYFFYWRLLFQDRKDQKTGRLDFIKMGLRRVKNTIGRKGFLSFCFIQAYFVLCIVWYNYAYPGIRKKYDLYPRSFGRKDWDDLGHLD